MAIREYLNQYHGQFDAGNPVFGTAGPALEPLNSYEHLRQHLRM
jgi:hypothetical protein